MLKVLHVLTILLLITAPVSTYYDSHKGDIVHAADQPLVIFFFYANGCSYCEAASSFLQDLKTIYPTLEIFGYDIYFDPDAREFYTQILAYFDRSPQGMPTIIIGDRIWVGFQSSYEQEIISTLNICQSEGCLDLPANMLSESPDPINKDTTQPKSDTLELLFLGEVSLTSMPLILSTFIIGFVDGFNPCSLWVLTVLLSLTIHMQSRPRILLVGLTFILVSTLTYALFISGIFTMLSVLEYHSLIQILFSLIALVFSVINIKDYFFFKQGPSLTISDQAKPGLYQRMRQLVSLETSGIALILGTVVFSVGVSLIEFSCTAGFPIIWVNLLARQQVDSTQYILLLLIYLFIYMIDELLIFFSVVITMRSIKLNTQQGRFLKLLSGLVMLALAVIMLIRPELMNSLPIVFGIFAGVILLSFLIDYIKHCMEK